MWRLPSPFACCAADIPHRWHSSLFGSPAACYVPCDPGYPDDRLAIYLEDAQATVLLTEPAHRRRAETLAAFDCPVACVAEVCAQPGVDTAAISRSASPEDPAYIIFTSGSTGRPKGCVLPHRGLQDLLPWLVDLHRLSELPGGLASGGSLATA